MVRAHIGRVARPLFTVCRSIRAFARIAAVAALSSAVWTGEAAATVVNGGFESGAAGWTGIGDAGIKQAGFGITPDEGIRHALMTTHHPVQSESSEPILNSGAGPAVDVSSLEAFAGLSAGALALLGDEGAVQGSAVKQSFSVAAGDTLSFRFNFLSEEQTLGSEAANDFAFVSLLGADGILAKLADIFTPASAINNPGTGADNHFDFATGFLTFAHTFTVGGLYTLAVGVLDDGDDDVGSALLLDAVSLSAATAVPEPGTLAVLGFGLIALAGFGRRWRQRLIR